jgi:uncharacterized protein (DUF58 family)
VAWKAVARSDELLTKQFTGEAAAQLWLDWRLPAALGWSSAFRASPAGCSLPSAPARSTACAFPARDRARARRAHAARVPAGARALRRGMKRAAHPLLPRRGSRARDLVWLAALAAGRAPARDARAVVAHAAHAVPLRWRIHYR